MKKLIFTMIFLVITLTGFSQTYRSYTVTSAEAVTTDKSWVIGIGELNVRWRVDVIWTSNNATTSAVKIQSSVDGVYWTDYAGLTSLTITGSSGNGAFEDEYTIANYLRVVYTEESGKIATFTIKFTQKK